MGLRSKFIFLSAVGIAVFMGFGVMVVVNLGGLLGSARAASAEYEAMDRAAATSAQTAWLRDALRGRQEGGGGGNPITYRDPRFLDPIRAEVARIAELLRSAAAHDVGDAARESDLIAQLAAQFAEADRLSRDTATAPHVLASQLDLTLRTLATIADLTPAAARRHVTSGTDRLMRTLEWSCVWLVMVLAVSAVVHYRQYRALVRPLMWLRDEMRDSAARQYRPLPEAVGHVDPEYRELATHYNKLTLELSALYRDLERKVVARSRELVRSERLASVGYLAAGVAHEINNPLSVISGYSELAGKALGRLLEGGADRTANGESTDAESERHAADEAEAIAEALEAQRVIREESFRCKEITSRLLSLARGGTDAREDVSVDEVARRVVTLTHGLRQFRDRQVRIEVAEPGLFVHANVTELKQVLLNLTVNALEAVAPSVGRVAVVVRRSKVDHGGREGGWVEVAVEDNGKGMSAEVLEQVFEPFFTGKRGVGEPGTGLGLSITHAIVEAHGGQILAESSGPGLGSRFVVRLPAVRGASGRLSPSAAG